MKRALEFKTGKIPVDRAVPPHMCVMAPQLVPLASGRACATVLIQALQMQGWAQVRARQQCIVRSHIVGAQVSRRGELMNRQTESTVCAPQSAPMCAPQRAETNFK